MATENTPSMSAQQHSIQASHRGAPTPLTPQQAGSPPSKRELASWWKNFRKTTKKEEDKGKPFSTHLPHCSSSSPHLAHTTSWPGVCCVGRRGSGSRGIGFQTRQVRTRRKARSMSGVNECVCDRRTTIPMSRLFHMDSPLGLVLWPQCLVLGKASCGDIGLSHWCFFFVSWISNIVDGRIETRMSVPAGTTAS